MSSGIYAITGQLISFLETEAPEAKNIKARLRRSVGKEPGEDAELWGWLMSRLPEEFWGKGGKISYAEYAVYIALTAFSIGPTPSRDKDITFTRAMAIAGIDRLRLGKMETASNIKMLQAELKGLVMFIASKGCPFNYGALAEDLYSWQFDKIATARKWEREYARKENDK